MRNTVMLHIKIIFELLFFGTMIYLAWNYSNIFIPNFLGTVVKIIVVSISGLFVLDALSLLWAIFTTRD